MSDTRSRTSSGPRRFIGGAVMSANRTAPSRCTSSVSNSKDTRITAVDRGEVECDGPEIGLEQRDVVEWGEHRYGLEVPVAVVTVVGLLDAGVSLGVQRAGVLGAAGGAGQPRESPAGGAAAAAQRAGAVLA